MSTSFHWSQECRGPQQLGFDLHQWPPLNSYRNRRNPFQSSIAFGASGAHFVTPTSQTSSKSISSKENALQDCRIFDPRKVQDLWQSPFKLQEPTNTAGGGDDPNPAMSSFSYLQQSPSAPQPGTWASSFFTASFNSRCRSKLPPNSCTVEWCRGTIPGGVPRKMMNEIWHLKSMEMRRCVTGKKCV